VSLSSPAPPSSSDEVQSSTFRSLTPPSVVGVSLLTAWMQKAAACPLTDKPVLLLANTESLLWLSMPILIIAGACPGGDDSGNSATRAGGISVGRGSLRGPKPEMPMSIDPREGVTLGRLGDTAVAAGGGAEWPPWGLPQPTVVMEMPLLFDLEAAAGGWREGCRRGGVWPRCLSTLPLSATLIRSFRTRLATFCAFSACIGRTAPSTLGTGATC